MFTLHFTLGFVSLVFFDMALGGAPSENLLQIMREIEKEVGELKKGFVHVEEEVNAVTAREEKAEKIKSLGYTFIGFGIWGTYSGATNLGDDTTLLQCLRLCHDKRQKNSLLNGVIWIKRNGRCLILSNDHGHRSASKFADFYHYRAE